MSARGVPGQAAVETVGIVTAVVLALAATTVWLVGAARPPDRPPDVIGQVSRPLGFPDGLRYWALPAVPHGQEGADEPIGDALRGFGRGTVTATRAYLRGRQEFSGAYSRRLRERLSDVLADPLGDGGLPELDVLTPGGALRRVLRDGAAARDYVRRLRALPRDELGRTILRDAGTFAADATVEVLQALARRRAARVGRPPTGRRPAPPRDAPQP